MDRIDVDPPADPDPLLGTDHVDTALSRLTKHRANTARYDELGTLGQGAMGLVLEVRDLDLRRTLALKRMRTDGVPGSDPAHTKHRTARFLQEAQITGQLGHPGIPPVHELGLDAQERPYFTMPLIRGEDLSAVIVKARANDAGWNVPRALAVLVRVCEAMAYAHAKRVVHRDLKPQNVRIGRFGEVYVLDWGLARVLGREARDIVRWGSGAELSTVSTDRRSGDSPADDALMTLDGDVLGTPYFMAPEQARGDLEQVDMRSDVYAVGAMLYLLLCGRAPYQPEKGRISARTVLAMVIYGPPPPLAELAPDADPDLVAICDKAMAREPAARYATMEELAADMEAWLGRRPVRAKIPSLAHALRLYYERHRATVWTAAAALVALLALGTLFVVRLTKEIDLKELALRASQRRGDAMAAAALEEHERRLWPAVPEQIPALEDWLSEADEVSSRLPGYRAQLPQAGERDRVEIQATLDGSERIEKLRPSIESRLALARTIETVSIDAERAAWERVAADVASDPRFSGMVLAPQLGLVPLRKDEDSGLWEFWHVASGARPTGETPRAEDGVVLVLLPPGELTVGSGDEADVWQPKAGEPPRPIAAFFCAKHEFTQAQWLRATGTRPSRWQPGAAKGASDCPTCPVESVSWLKADQCLFQLGLRLPGESEWEYACLAGSPHRNLVHGPDPADVEGAENVRDALLGSGSGLRAAPWKDGFIQVAPIGSFRPNLFGLHDVVGNVSEWCSDRFEVARPAESVASPSPLELRVFRGGSWYHSLYDQSSHVWYRQKDAATALNHTRGLRAARSVLALRQG